MRRVRPVAPELAARQLSAPPASPLGVKFELTHRCNLLCPFCYTDSPRRTREGGFELDDQRWLEVAREAVSLGVLEAVLTGGEPLLRRDLAVALVHELAGARVATTITTNGWHLDDELADTLAAVGGVHVNVSIDGHTPELHDGARGVRGSWERAVAGVDRLLTRGVRVQVVHVVTPANQRFVPDLFAAMADLGLRHIRVAATIPAGAAARGAHDWSIDQPALRRAIRAAIERDPGLAIIVTGDGLGVIDLEGGGVPGSFLVRPTGAVVIDSLRPFSYGSVDDGLAACWERIRSGWRTDEVVTWSHSGEHIDELSVVPYRDPDLAVAGTPVTISPRRSASAVPEGVPAIGGPGDVAAARSQLQALALHRPYRWADIRVNGAPGAERWVRPPDRRELVRLNPTAGLVLEACRAGTPADAIALLCRRAPSVDPTMIAADVLRTVPELVDGGLLRPGLRPAARP